MPDDDWQRVHEVFLEAADLPPVERTGFLERVCAGSARLRQEVESLLQEDGSKELDLDAAIQAEAAGLLDQAVLTGSRLGAYRIVEEIGLGGMGSVYLAERADDQFRKRVAIKIVKRGMDTVELLRRFRQERQILAGLDHPYIARLIDGGTTPDGRPFFVMEHVEGEPIDAYCSTRKLDLQARLRLFLRVCDAVSHAHRALVVHRDLKPGNILVTREGAPKLLDFGVAKLLDPGADPGLTATVYGPGPLTPEYASPEQVRGLPITTATDVYALGAILFELLTGERAQNIQTHTPSEVDRVVCETQPPRPSVVAKGLNADLDNIVLMAMRKEPDRRYSSVDQLADDIRRYLQALPIVARRDVFSYRAAKFMRRHRIAITAAALVFASLVAGVLVSAREARQALAARILADRERARAEREAVNAGRQQHEAEVQRTAAESERQVAERRFQQVRQLAGKFLLDFHDAIARLPGSTPARKMVVETGLQYYDSLAREASGNRDLLEEAARGYDRLGDVQGNPYAANLGDVPGALQSYGKALAIRTGISDPSPAFLRDRVLGQVRTGQVLALRGDLKKAQDTFREAIAIGAASSDYEVRQAVLKAYSSLGDLEIRADSYSEAIAVFQKLLDLSIEFARAGRDPAEEERALSLAQTKLGDVLSRVGRNREALEHLRIAAEIDRRLADAEPNNLLATRKLYISYVLLGRVFRSRTGRELAAPGETNSTLEAAVAMADKMAAADPNNNLALMDVVAARTGLGDLLLQQKQFEAAAGHYRKLVDAAERLIRAGSNVLANLDAGVQAHQRLGMALVGMGHPGEALEHFQKAAEHLAASGKLNPGIIRYRTQAEIDAGRGEAFQAQARWQEAIAAFSAAIRAYQDERARDPQDETMLSEQPHLYGELASCYAAAGDFRAAAQAARTALERFREIEASRPLVEEEQTERAGISEKLAQWSR